MTFSDLPVLTTATYTNLAGGTEYIRRLRNFFSTLGWTENEWHDNNVVWKTLTPFGWIAGSESFLDVSTTGYGAQAIRFNFRMELSDATRHKLWIAPVDPVVPNYSLQATRPCAQTSPHHVWQAPGYFHGTNMPAGTIPQVWFFGNAHFLASVIQCTTGTNIIWGLGSPTLVDEYQSRTDLWFQWLPQVIGDPMISSQYWDNMLSNPTAWWNGFSYPFLDNPASGAAYAYVESAVRDQTNYYYYTNACQGQNALTITGGKFDNLNQIALFNSFSNQRPGIIPSIYIKKVSTQQWSRVGMLPLAYVRSSGIAIGDELDYGGQTYIAFPNRYSTDTTGVIFRVS
jgi:hypothetical protein